jgi:hypothetical protein
MAYFICCISGDVDDFGFVCDVSLEVYVKEGPFINLETRRRRRNPSRDSTDRSPARDNHVMISVLSSLMGCYVSS